MTARPLNIRVHEAQAIHADRLSLIVRPMKPQPDEDGMNANGWPVTLEQCPLGKPGDELWCRETWKFHDWTEDGEPFVQYAADEAVKLCRVPYEIDGGWVSDTWERLSHPSNYDIDGYARDRRWRSPVTMPRWASRFTLRVIEVGCKQENGIWVWTARVERVMG